MAKHEWKENKGRRPYTADVLVDVQLRSDSGLPVQREGHPAGRFDWSIENVRGDILSYRKSEIQNV